MDLVTASGWFSFVIVLMMFMVDRIFRAKKYYLRGYSDGYSAKRDVDEQAKLTLFKHGLKK